MQLPNNAEHFRAVNNFPVYEISNEGRPRNSKTGRILVPQMNGKLGNQYQSVKLYKNGKSYNKKVHILVAEAFIPNPTHLPTVDHISRDKNDNSVDNLRWADNSMQQRNKGIQVNNTSGRKGVDYDRINKSWRAQIVDNNGYKISKSFSLNKYPDAFTFAVCQREHWEQQYNYTPV